MVAIPGEDGEHCRYCQRKIVDNNCTIMNLTWMFPDAASGTSIIHEIVVMCRVCSSDFIRWSDLMFEKHEATGDEASTPKEQE